MKNTYRIIHTSVPEFAKRKAVIALGACYWVAFTKLELLP